MVAGLFAHVPDLRFDARRMYFGDDHMIFEYEMSGTADNNEFVCDGVDVISVRDGLVARKDTYLDLAAYERQAGALPGSSTTTDA
jgi:ketosteroid isomerase-like protein